MRTILNILRAVHLRLFPNVGHFPVDVTGEDAQAFIRKGVEGDKPFMAARFGSIELDCIAKYQTSTIGLRKYIRYVQGTINSLEIDEIALQDMSRQPGFFPTTKENLERFSRLMIADIPHVDVLGSWRLDEIHFNKELKNAVRVKLADIEPYYYANPWTVALRGKKVLLVHPFESTIQSQYRKREKIFHNPDVLPEFELKTIKAVQSIVGTKTPFADWFEALDSMKRQIDQVDFDVAIIGCGAFGFPLAAHVKRIGKKAVHMGGATQLLFGIYGKRWEDNARVMALVNDHWVRPSQNETPTDFKKAEDGAYW